MKENYDLIEQIGELRRNRDKLSHQMTKTGSASGSIANSEAGMTGRKLDADHSNVSMSQENWYEEELNRKRQHISEFKDKIREQEKLAKQISAA